VSDFRYAQLCPLARAAEVVGERWTLLVVRELAVGPQRFSDLRRRLPGVSTSVLADRLERLERRGVVAHRRLPAPAGSLVYELDAAGRDLLPAVVELTRWGARFLLPGEPGDHVEPDWLRVALRAFAGRGATPELVFEVRVRNGPEDVVLTVEGGAEGTRVHDGPARVPAEARLRAAAPVVLGLVAGLVDPREAARAGQLDLSGDPETAAGFARLFDVDLGGRPATAAASRPGGPPRPDVPSPPAPPPGGAVPHPREE
jgi:DNA-binding HxlR family transcriptional regulator